MGTYADGCRVGRGVGVVGYFTYRELEEQFEPAARWSEHQVGEYICDLKH